MATISEFLTSANSIKGYESSSVAHKKFGAIFLFNKVIAVRRNHNVMEVSMHIKAVSDYVPSRGGRRLVDTHRVRIAINGIDKELLTAQQLVKKIRDTFPKYADKDEFPGHELIKKALSGEIAFGDTQVFEAVEPGKRGMKDKWQYALVSKFIDPEKHSIKVHCSCSSYYWTFIDPNLANDVNISTNMAAPGQSNFTSMNNNRRKPQNPGHKMGACKHIMLTLGLLLQQRLINGDFLTTATNPAFYVDLRNFQTVSRLSRPQYEQLLRRHARDVRKQSRHRALRAGRARGGTNRGQRMSGMYHRGWRRP